VSTDKRDATSDYRGIVIKRDLDAERPSRSADRTEETESKKKRFSIGRSIGIGNSDDDIASETEIKTEPENTADQHSRSRFTSSPSVTTQIQPVVSSPFASLSMPRSKTHGPAHAYHVQTSAWKSSTRYLRMNPRLPCTGVWIGKVLYVRQLVRPCGRFWALPLWSSYCL